jgi:4-hydroxybenzoate polyprenyltransferase
VSLFNGLVVEIGRKIRVLSDEEEGVQTYSALWGPKTATIAWLTAMGLTTTFAGVSAYKIGFMWSVLGILGVFMSTAIVLSIRFLGKSEKGAGKAIENMAGIWTLAMYLTVGAYPLVWKLFWGGGR